MVNALDAEKKGTLLEIVLMLEKKAIILQGLIQDQILILLIIQEEEIIEKILIAHLVLLIIQAIANPVIVIDYI